MQLNTISLATLGNYGVIPGFITALAVASEGEYGVFSVFAEEGLLVHSVQLYEENTTIPIVQARVDLFDSNNLIRLRSGVSDVYGRVLFAGLLSGQYTLRIAKLGVYNFPLFLVSVFDDFQTSIVYGQPIVLSAPVSPQLCRIYIFLTDFGLVPTKGVKVFVRVVSLPQPIDGYLLDWVAKVFETDENGQVYFDAARNAKIFIQLKEAGIEREFIVPDVDVVNLKDLL